MGAVLGFKAGMAHEIALDDRDKIPNYGKPLFVPFTVVTLPKIHVFGVRLYGKGYGGMKIYSDILNLKDERVFGKGRERPAGRLPDKSADRQPKEAGVAGQGTAQPAGRQMDAGAVQDVRLLTYVVPAEAGTSEKKAVRLEIPMVGGAMEKRIEVARSMIGTELSSADLLKRWPYVDAFWVTKGKGIEGPVTRQGIKRKQHKSRKSVRAVGVLGAWHPHDVTYTVPRAGQMGYHRRPILNLRVLKVLNSSSDDINPKSGFNKFGLVGSDYALIKGSLPGPTKRPILIRSAVRKRTAGKDLKVMSMSVGGVKVDA